MSTSPLPQFLCLPPSQSTDALLWSFARCNYAVQEFPHVPVLHVAATQWVARTNDIPILVLEKENIAGAVAIFQYLGKQPDCAEFLSSPKFSTEEFNTLLTKYLNTLSYYVGQWAYAYLLPEKSICLPMLTAGVPWYERLLAPLGYYWISSSISQGFAITPGGQAASVVEIRKLAAEAMQLLSDGRPYLGGDRLTALDIAFVTSLAPAVLPPNYTALGLPLDQLPAPMASDIRSIRETDFAQYVTRIYTERATADCRRCPAP